MTFYFLVKYGARPVLDRSRVSPVSSSVCGWGGREGGKEGTSARASLGGFVRRRPVTYYGGPSSVFPVRMKFYPPSRIYVNASDDGRPSGRNFSPLFAPNERSKRSPSEASDSFLPRDEFPFSSRCDAPSHRVRRVLFPFSVDPRRFVRISTIRLSERTDGRRGEVVARPQWWTRVFFLIR